MSQDKPGINLMDTDWQKADFHCITCSDEAVTVRVLSVDQESALAKVEVVLGGATEEVDISLVDAVTPGDMLLAHGGVALARVSGD